MIGINDSTTNHFGSLIRSGGKYIIPQFQRDYSWEEEQWDDLWQDIDIMYDEKGETLYGGEHYEVIRDPERVFDVKALEDQVVMPETPITFNAVNIGEPATYVWYNTAGDSIASGTTLNTTATQSQQYRLSVQATADGYKGYDTVSVVVRNGAITSLSPNPATNQVVVSYSITNQVQGGTVQISNTSGIVLLSTPFTASQTSTTLNLQNLVAGQYNVRLVSATGEVMDTKTLIVQ